ncbi:aminotransferase class I/II-fold pyridoxal phosphate-dependent enzyme [Georgenia sp. SUBG003]|uniref:aminotransferase class I/II-fold pyridoxal phosphate-dependent enzyme n=1 Tax=Georgenia sp. SUBG003 TaxID=1497974 RepID=UPI0004D709C6|nr:aminotransferase [Georgenia sp. SUBG003]
MELSRRAGAAREDIRGLTDYFTSMRSMDGRPDVLDLTFGNPHEMPLEGLVAALRTSVEPRTVDWFAYKSSERAPRETVATALAAELGLPFEAEDVQMTQGAFGAIALALRLVGDAGDEVVIPQPAWPCYPSMLRAADMVPVRAALRPDTFGLDVEAIDRAISPRTRIVLVNSPANPTGRVYRRDELEALAAVLEQASSRNGRRVWLLSDEPYRRIRFDGTPFVSPAACYPWTLIDYSYGKVLLAPGQRLGYLALSPTMPPVERESLRAAALPLQLALGWTFPDAVMQYAVPALETVSIDLAELTRKRDRMLAALQGAGYRVTRPEGTFYLWSAAPGGDGDAYAAALAQHGVYVLSGRLFGAPGHFRISLTATMDTVERALPAMLGVAARAGVPTPPA